jgi:H+-transporting ATPase
LSQPSRPPEGLSEAAAKALLASAGPNSVPDTTDHPLVVALKRLWAPVPWMLEAAIVLELIERNLTEAAVIAGLLVFNSVVGYLQEGKAQSTLATLKSRLALTASVRRDGQWNVVPSDQIVPGDVVKLELGAVVVADVTIVEGSVLVDQSMLTGESEPVQADVGATTYAGALVRRGEATAEVTATGVKTKFGNTAELVLSAHVTSSQQKVVMSIVRNLALFNVVVIVALVLYASLRGISTSVIVPLVLTAVLATIPVALPATFTLASALGARVLAKRGVLSTRLSSIDEAASMDVLCTDKTGTLTMNKLTVQSVWPAGSNDKAHVLAMAGLACAEGSQDPVELAIIAARDQSTTADKFELVSLTPFDPTTKMSEALVRDADGQSLSVALGAYTTVTASTKPSADVTGAVQDLEKEGLRVLAVASGGAGKESDLVGLIGLSDPPRPDSASLISELTDLGVTTVMVTGDAPATAASVATAVGLAGDVCPPGKLPADLRPEQYAVFAGIFPEGKYDLVKAFQKSGHVVGMCGDGANDAPALRQAQMGVAVATATDVAKSAAGIVLTTAGLEGIVAAVTEGRSAYQRILTYSLNVITKKITNVLFILAGLIITGHAILTPMLMVIIMVTGDFLGMSLTTDNVRASTSPASWQIRKLTMAGTVMGAFFLAFCISSLLVGRYVAHFDVGDEQTLCMVTLIFGGEAILYNVRERAHLWHSIPGKWVMIATVADIIIVSSLAVGGFAIKALPITDVLALLGAAMVFAVLLDQVKVPLFRRLGIAKVAPVGVKVSNDASRKEKVA